MADMMNRMFWGFEVYENQLTSLGWLLVFILACILFIITSSYRCHFKQDWQQRAKIPAACKLLVELSTKIKYGLGWTVLGVMFCLLPFYSTRIQRVFGDSVTFIIQYFYHVGRLISILLLAAWAHTEFQTLLEPWISMGGDDLGTVENIRMKVLLVDVLHRDGFGLRGRGVTVTYIVFGSIMAAILAYSIAVVQLQSG